jgi:hypothetical protein
VSRIPALLVTHADLGAALLRAAEQIYGPVGDVEVSIEGLTYCALWTHHNQKNWPKAIKIRFRIYEKRMPKEFRGTDGKGGMEYEVICNLGQ